MSKMDTKRQIEFYELLEKLIFEMSDATGMDVDKINGILAVFCKMFRISRGESRFYESLGHERDGRCETFVCYDNGELGQAVMNIRVVTRAQAVVTCSVFMADGEEPLSDEERSKVDLLMRTVLSFVSRNRLQRVVERLAFHDNAGFHNMRFFQQYLDRMNESASLGGRAALHYNFRRFSLVNQEVGKAAGDVVLFNHYQGLQRLIGEDGVVARLGGDNFIAVCRQDQLDEVLRYLGGTPVVYDNKLGTRIMISATAGIFPIPYGFVMHGYGEVMDKIISSSNAARSGKKEPFIYFDRKLLLGKEKVMRVQQRFPDAMKNEEFKVYYQPKIDIATGELAGAEALCRWFRGGTLIPPAEFIPVLEENTDICKLDFYMLEHVCRDLRRWLDEGRRVVRISVNLSRRHMMDIDLLKTIIEIIDRYRVPHQYIEIELTETTTDVEFRDLKRVVGGLQQAGIYTSVDDFGIGYSSLNLIREIPWNVLKVDRSFLPVEDDDAGSTRSIMFRHVVAMARELGLECIAEGVETKDQVDVLRDNHCDLAQGFFFDHPLSVEDFEKRLSGHPYSVEDGAPQ